MLAALSKDDTKNLTADMLKDFLRAVPVAAARAAAPDPGEDEEAAAPPTTDDGGGRGPGAARPDRGGAGGS